MLRTAGAAARGPPATAPGPGWGYPHRGSWGRDISLLDLTIILPHLVLMLAMVSGWRKRKGCSLSTSSMQSHTTRARLAVRSSCTNNLIRQSSLSMDGSALLVFCLSAFLKLGKMGKNVLKMPNAGQNGEKLAQPKLISEKMGPKTLSSVSESL